MSPVAQGVLIVVICAFIEGLAQIAWKKSAQNSTHKLRWISMGVLAYCVEIPLYTFALTKIDVTVAFAMGSLSFVSVALLSRLLVGEKISNVRAVGLFFILCGVALMGGHA